MQDAEVTSLPRPIFPLRTVRLVFRWLYRGLVLPLTGIYLAFLVAGLAALGFSALRALLQAVGLFSGGAFDWFPDLDR